MVNLVRHQKLPLTGGQQPKKQPEDSIAAQAQNNAQGYLPKHTDGLFRPQHVPKISSCNPASASLWPHIMATGPHPRMCAR